MTSLHAARLERKLSRQREDSFSLTREPLSQTLVGGHQRSLMKTTAIP